MIGSLQNKPYYLFLLSILGSISLTLGSCFNPYFLFVAFVPLFEIDIFLKLKDSKNNYLKYILYIFLALFLWNLLFFGYFMMSDLVPFIGILALIALIQSLVFVFFRMTRDAINEAYGYFAFVLYWLAMEYVLLQFGAPWDLLILGNAFAGATYLIQWYELTGVQGGSSWVLVINIFLYLAIRSKFLVNRKVFSIYVGLILAIFYVFSLYFVYAPEEKTYKQKIQMSEKCTSVDITQGEKFGQYFDEETRLSCISPKNNLPLSITDDLMRLRAIEFRLVLFTQNNKHIQTLTKPSGEQIQLASEDTIEIQLFEKQQQTPYALYGDYMGRLAAFLAVALFLTGLIRQRVGAKNNISKVRLK